MFKPATAAIALTAALLTGGIAVPPASPAGSPAAPSTPATEWNSSIAVIDQPEAGIGCWLLFWTCR